jgi:16S rRNA processing protein RimM
LRGEIFADGDVAHAARLAGLSGARIVKPGGEDVEPGRTYRIQSATEFKGRLLLRLEGIDSIGQAEALTGCELLVEREVRPALAEDEVYLGDLVGCEVLDSRSGRLLGRVTGWLELGGPTLLEVAEEGQAGGEALLVPFAKSICVEIDTAAKRIRVDLPEGLSGLNRTGPDRA